MKRYNKMTRLSLHVVALALVCHWGSFPATVDCATVLPLVHNNRFIAKKHVVLTAKEHRDKELAAFLKNGTMPDAPIIYKIDASKHDMVDKLQNVPTEVLVKQFVEGGDHIKKHLDATGRRAGTPSPSISPVHGPTKEPKEGKGMGKVPPPTKYPKETKVKGKKGKDKSDKSDSTTKVPKEKKKGGKMKKEDKEYHASDVPSSSPTPTIPPAVKGDVALPKGYDVDHENVNSSNEDTSTGGDSNGDEEEKGRSSDNNSSSDESSNGNSTSITKIVTPIAALAGLFFIGGVWLSRRRKVDKECDDNENLMKHKEGYDVETGTVSGNTYRTGAFTEDDNTLGESVDVHEDYRRIKVSHNQSKEKLTVLQDLEEVSLNDDGASTTSVSSGYHSPSISDDERFIDAARAAMTAEALRPDKAKVYDGSVKPEWATRSNNETSEATNEPIDLHILHSGATSHSLDKVDDDEATVVTASYRTSVEANDDETYPETRMDTMNTFLDVSVVATEAVVPSTMIPSIDESVDNVDEDRPEWMKAKLRPVSQTVTAPKSEVFTGVSTTSDTEPEWMKKFKQMGLDKKE